MREMTDAFAPELFKARRGAGDPSEVPVFIVGMPRSGTTLVEQILASHPNVFGAGEPMYLFELVAGGHAGADFPSGIASLPDERCASWAISMRRGFAPWRRGQSASSTSCRRISASSD